MTSAEYIEALPQSEFELFESGALNVGERLSDELREGDVVRVPCGWTNRYGKVEPDYLAEVVDVERRWTSEPTGWVRIHRVGSKDGAFLRKAEGLVKA